MLVVTLALLLIAAEVGGLSGRPARAGCYYCRTHCARWGPADKPHCHGGGDRFAAAVVAVRKEYRLNSVGRRLFGLIIPEPSA